MGNPTIECCCGLGFSLIMLSAWGGNNYTTDEYVMAALIGLDNAGEKLGQDVSQQAIDEVNTIYSTLMTGYGITPAQMSSFLNSHTNSVNNKLTCHQ